MAKLSLGMSGGPSDQEALGLEMLKNGTVTPEEVQAAQIAMKDPTGTKDWLGKYLGKNSPNPYTLKSEGEATPPTSMDDMVAAAPKKIAKGVQTKQEAKSRTDTKNAVTQNTYLGDEQLNNIATSLRQLPEFQDQQQGVDELEKQIAAQEKAPYSNQDWFVKPFLGLTDAQTGSNFSKNFTPQETMADRNAKLLKAKEDLQKRKGDMSKALLEGITKLKSGSESNSTMNSLSNLMAYNQGMMGGRNGIDQGDKQDVMAHQRNIMALKKDTLMRQNLGNLQRIENALNNTAGVDELTNQQFHELQQAIRSSITKGSGGVDERAATYYQSLGMSKDQFMQWLDSKPKSLKLNNPFVQHVLEIGNLELSNIKRQASTQAKLLLGGNKSVYDRRPDLKGDLTELGLSLEDTFTPKITEKGKPMPKKPKAGAAPVAAAAGGPAVDADLSKMSNEELQAYIAAHGG